MPPRCRLRRAPVQRERAEQQACRQFLVQALHARVYTLGTTRRKGDHPGTMQTPGLPDLIAFVPVPPLDQQACELLTVECKVGKNTRTAPQDEFREFCGRADVAHVTGGLNEVIAWAIEKHLVRPEHVPFYRLPDSQNRSVRP